MKLKSLAAVGASAAFRQSAIVFSVVVSALLSGQRAEAAARTWTGLGSDANWATAGNWSALPVAGDSLTFAGTTQATNVNNLTADINIAGLSFTNTANGQSFNISGNRITLGGNITTTAAAASANITDSIGLNMILSGNRTITTNIRHNLTVTGIISEDATSRSLIKAGVATLTLQGANTFTGSLQINEGVLTLSGLNGSANLSSGVIINGTTLNLTNTNALNNTNRLKDDGTVIMSGGTFNFGITTTIGSYSETTGALSITSGVNTVTSGQAASGQTSALTFESLTRTAGATINFTGTGLGNTARNRVLITANPILSNSIIGSWATVNSTDWASYDATNGVIAIASYTNDAWAAGNNTTVTTSSAPTSASETNSLRFNQASADTVTLAGVNTISSGGILVSSGVGANLSTITGGTLQGAAGGELVVHQHNTAAGSGLTLGSSIRDNTSATSLVKIGGGALTLTGTNIYTGGTIINAGSVVLANTGSGESLQGNVTLSGTGRLVLGKSDQISDTSVITFASGANNARFQLTSAAGTNFSEIIGGIADAAGTFTGNRIVESAGDGVSNSPATLIINTAGSSYIFGGIVRNAAGTLSPAGSSNLSIVKDGLGTQEFSGAAGSVSYSGSTTVKAGTLRLTGTNSVINNSAISLEGGTIEFAGGGTRTLAITSTSSAWGVIKSGTGTVIFQADNTYTGETRITNGTLTLDRSGGTIADTGTVSVNGDTSILNVAQSDTIGALNLSLAATVSGAGTLTVTTAITPNIAIDKTNNISASLAGAAYLRKTGQGTTILSAANSYTGGTILRGSNSKLTISGAGTLGSTSGALSIETASAVLDLGGTSQTVGSVSSIGTVANGTLNVSTQLSVGVTTITADPFEVTPVAIGTATFNNLNLGAGSIFEWDFNASDTADIGVVADAATGTYDNVVATGDITGGAAIFKVVLSGNSFADAFWNTDKSWSNIFGGAGTPDNLAAVFSSFSATGGLDSSGAVSGRGQFTFNGSSSTLNWTAVPEPTSALAGLLLGFGLLRRRRG